MRATGKMALLNCQGNISRSIREAKSAGASKRELIEFLEHQIKDLRAPQKSNRFVGNIIK
tara:strand:- start:360 stop:539 length:180 start_codon:yes stop_codon:yes gene_type:complete